MIKDAKQTSIEKIPDFVLKLTKPDDLKNVMENAKNKNRTDVYWVAFDRLCEVEGTNYLTELEQDFYKTLTAYEILLSEKNGRTTKANRTRQKLKRHGFKKCLEDWALSKEETSGFSLLVENGQAGLTSEAVVVRHSHSFSEDVVSAAKQRLDLHNVDYS